MHDSKTGRTSLRIDNLEAALEQGIENETGALEVLVVAAGKGNPHPELWRKLHMAAARDDRFSELAFAYERMCADRRVTALPAPLQSDVLMHAATFFADTFSDPVGARSYLERVVTIAPGRMDAFLRLEQILTDAHESVKLADLYAAVAMHRPERADQLELLRRAAKILDALPDEQDRAVKVLQQILKVEPGDPAARRGLEAVLVRAGKLGELARMLEQALAADPGPGPADAKEMRARLVGLYAGELRELERALPHVEEMLAVEPGHAAALQVAETLLGRKAVATRAAGALEGAYEKLGRVDEAVRMMTLQIESLRGPRRVDVQKRLLELLFQKLGDLTGAHALCEQILAVDPSDDQVRARYLTLAAALDKKADATRVLGRASTGAKDKAARARISVEIGELYVDLGDPRKARTAFQQVIEGAADDGATLRAARGLSKLCEKEKDVRGLAGVLVRLADVEPEPEAREQAAERLAQLCEGELRDPAGAIVAYRKLISTTREPAALAALERLYEATGAHAELAEVLERRAEASADRGAARELALRAAELRSTKLDDRAAAIEAWGRFVAKFGPAREAYARLLPMLEAERRWGELAQALEGDATLAERAERPAVLARLGAIRASRLQDPAGALAAYRDALAIEPAERTSRVAVEKMLAAPADGGRAQRQAAEPASGRHSQRPPAPDLRLAACAVLEPIARAEGAAALLLRVLEVKADLAGAEADEAPHSAAPHSAAPPTSRGGSERPVVHEAVTRPPPSGWPSGEAQSGWTAPPPPPLPRGLGPTPGPKGPAAQLAALEEAVGIAERELKDPKRAIELARRGLGIAVAGAADRVARWVAEIERLTQAGSDAARRAAALAGALGDRAVDGPEMSHLAQRAGEALVASGDVARALALYRRALAFEPSSPELLARVDALLQEQGSPEERIALQREALTRPTTPARRRQILHAIGAIQRRDLNDLEGAAATYRAALEDDADDVAAYEALLEAYAAAGAWESLYEALAERLGRVERQARVGHELRMADVATRGGRTDRAAEHYRQILARGEPLPDDALAAMEALARGAGDDALLRQVIERRVGAAAEPQEEALWLERLGDLVREADPPAAVAAWRRAAGLSETALGDPDRARRLYEQVLAIAPQHREAAARLLALYREQGAWERLPAVCEVLLDTAASADEALAELAVLEGAAARVRATDRFLAAAARLAEQKGPLSPEQQRAIDAALARVLAADPDRQDDAAAVYRRMLAAAPELPGAPADAALLDAFQGFLASSPPTPVRREDRRWLFALLAERRPEGERARALAAWAAWEERHVGDRAAAAALYARVLEIDPESDDALAARARLLLDVGDFEAAAEVLAARRDRSEGSARAALDVELASLLFERLGRPADALEVVAGLVEAGVDPAALAIAERALSVPETQARAASLLERAESTAEDTETRAALLETLLARTAAPPEVRRRWYERLLEQHAEDAGSALAVALRAVAELPSELPLWDRVEELGRATKQPERVAAAYAAALAQPGALEPDFIEEIGRRAVEHHEEWFDAPEATIGLLRRLVELAPASSWGFERLKLAYNAAERWDDLFALYDVMLERTEDARERVFLLEDAATVARDLAGDPERTMRYLEALLPLQDDARTRTTLERLYERYGKHRPLIDLLQGDLRRLPPDAAQKLRERIAVLWIEGVGDADAALPIAEQMLEAEPDDREAFAILERILAAPTSAAGPRPARQRAAALLERRYRAEERPADLARVLEVQLEAAEGAPRAALLREIVRIRRDALGDEAGALERLAALVELEPAAPEPRAELAEIAERLGRHDRLADVLAAAGARVEAPLAIALLQEAAVIRRDRLGDAGGAIALLRQIYATAEQHGDAAAALGATRELDRLLDVTGRAAERCDTLDLLARLESDAGARRRALGELARLAAAALGDHARAIAAYSARLEDDGADLEALDGLAAILEQAGRHRELTGVLDRRAQARGGDDARRDLSQVAYLFHRELGEPEQAIATWLRIRSELGPDTESGEALLGLYVETARWGELVDLLEEEARSALAAGDTLRGAELLRRLGDVHRDRTGAWERAVAAYRRAWDAVCVEGDVPPTEADAARHGLELLLRRIDPAAPEHRGALVAAVGALLSMCAAMDDWGAEVALLEPRLAAARADEDRVRILRASSALLEQRGADAAGAFDLAWRAFLLAPGPERPADVVRLADAAGRWSVVADALPELEARGDVPATTLRDLWRRVAAWHRDGRDDADAAEHAFERALAHDATSSAILFELAELQRRRPGPALVGTLLRLSDATGGDLDLYREAVETARDAVGDAAQAREIAETMLELAVGRWGEGGASVGVGRDSAFAGPSVEPAALWAIDALARLLADAGDAPGVVALCRRGAALPFPPAEQRRLRRRAAEAAPLDEAVALYGALFDEEPTDEPVGERLAELLREAGRREELVRLRERQIAVCQDGARRVALRYDAALLLVDLSQAGGDALGNAEAAIAALRKNLEEAPEHAPSAERLATLLESGGLHRDLLLLREEQAAAREAAGDAGGAAALWLQAATLAERDLDDAERAIAAHRRAAALGARDALDALARLLSARGEHDAAAEALERLCAGTPADRLHADALRLADVYVAGGRPERARACLEQALRTAEVTAPLRERLAALYREGGAWDALAELVAGNAALAEDPQARLALLREAADLHLGRGSAPGAAIPLLDEAIGLAPDDLSLRLARCRALAASGRADEATAALRVIIAGFGTRRPKERARVHYELARVALAGGDRAGAMAELDLALRIDPAHPNAQLALADLALEEGQLDRAHRAYRALLLVARRPGREGARAHAHGGDEGPSFSRAEILLSLGEIARRQGDAPREAEYVESAFESARESPADHQRFLDALRARGRHDLLARALEAQLEAAASDPAPKRATLLDELAALYEGPLGRAEAALDARLRALELRPDAPTTHEAALEIARRLDRIGRYVEVVERLLERAPDQRLEIALLLHLGRALELSPGSDAPAAAVYRRAEPLLEAARAAGQPDGERLDGVWRALEALYARLGNRAAEAEVLRKRIDAADDAGATAEGRSDPRYRLATLQAESAATLDETIALLEQALEIHPDADRAEAILRDALRADPKHAAAISLLERLARDADRPRALVDALVLRSAVEAGTAALEEAVRIARALGDRALAESLLAPIAHPDREPQSSAASGEGGVAWALVALAELREEAADLTAAAALRERAARISPPDEERALLLQVAALAAGPLDDLPRAARLYEELRGREPAEREIWGPLADVLRRIGDAARLSALLEETIPLVDSVAERCKLRLERARLAMASAPDQATLLLREVLDEDPSQVEAAILLASMLEQAGRLDELGELYALQLDAAKDRGDVPSIVSLSMRLGALLEQRGDEHGALDVYHAAIDWDASSRDALRAIVRLNMTREDSMDLPDALDKLLRVEQGDEAVRIALQLAELRVAQGDEAGAEQALEGGYAACPASDRLREELARRYTAREAWHKLAELHVLEAQVRFADDARVECLCRAAEVLRQRAGDPGAAADVLERALRIAPADRDVLLAFIDACGAVAQHARAAAAITHTLELNPEDPWLYRSRAALYEALGQGDAALADLERAYALGGRAYANELVEQLERTLARADAAAGAQADGAPAPGAPRDLRLRLAEVLSRAGDYDRARAHLTEVLRGDGKDRAALRTLASIEEASERWDAASAVYRRLISLEDGDALVSTALRLADACERAQRLGDARGGLERALRVAPQSAEVRERLRTLYNVIGASRELAQMALEDAAATSDVAGRFAQLLRAGRLLIDADDATQAITVLEEARSLRPEEQEASLLLVDALVAAGRRADARALLGELVAAHKGRRSKQLGAVHHRIARLEALEGRPRDSLAALAKAFENDSQNGALAMELAGYALEQSEHEIAARAFRAVTLMKIAPEGSAEGTTQFSRAVAYYHLGTMALAVGDRRKARLMLDKSVSEDASLEAARTLLDELRSG